MIPLVYTGTNEWARSQLLSLESKPLHSHKNFHSPFSSRFACRIFLSSYFPPSMTQFDKDFEVQKRGITLPLVEEISLLRRSPETSISLLTSTRIFHLFSPRRAVTANGPSHKGRSLSSPSRVVSDFRSQTRSSTGVSLLRVFDTAGYGRIRQDTAGYGRIRQDTAGYGRIRQDTAGYGRIRRIRQDTAGYCRYGRIRQSTAGYGRIRQGPKYLLICTTKTTILRSFSVRWYFILFLHAYCDSSG